MAHRNAGSHSTLPVFLFPNELTFVHTQPREKKILTLYNPYEFPIVYKVLSTASRKYTVLEPTGTVRPKSVVDVSIRHMTASERRSVGIVDHFKVEIHSELQSSHQGSKIIAVNLLETLDDDNDNVERSSFHHVARIRANTLTSNEGSRHFGTGADDHISNGNFLVLVLLAILCSTVLLFPTHYEDRKLQSIIPPILHPSVPQKIFFSFLLGIIVAVLLTRPRIN